MSYVKILSLIFLAVYLIFSALVDFMGFHLHTFANLLLGLSALASGILMLLSIHDHCHSEEEK